VSQSWVASLWQGWKWNLVDLLSSEFLLLEHAAEYADFGGEAEEE
jgi:hypothetical protein